VESGPISRLLYLPGRGSADGGHSSGPRLAARLERPTRELRGGPPVPGCLTAVGALLYLGLLRAGFAKPACLQTAGALLHPAPGGARRASRLHTISPLPGRQGESREAESRVALSPCLPGRVLSVALSVGLPLPAFRGRPALWRPDFPPRPFGHGGHPAHSPLASMPSRAPRVNINMPGHRAQ